MKTSEECFLEICENIKREIKSVTNFKIDNGEKIMTSVINYCKIHNYSGSYVYDGYIILNRTIEGHFTKMHYYFSDKRSYISIDDGNLTENEISKHEYYLLLYIDKLFINYKIDKFINSLVLDNIVV